LLGEVLPTLLDGCAPLLAEGVLRRISLDAYEREVERYGGDVGVRLAERVFYADSDAVLGVLRGVIGDDRSADMRWRLALIGIDRLLTDLGLNLADKHATVKVARDRLRRSLQVDAALTRRLAERFRSERSSLQELLDPSAEESVQGLDYYEIRTTQLRPIAEQICVGARAGRITQSLTALGDSFMHMHINRMLAGVTEAQELVLYDFLYRLYDSQAARRGA
jgi:thiopeptide-type bacteriocin biosynthesis protein